jgi:hypothetical protein
LADNLPPNLEGSRLAEKLQAIVELDLEQLQTIDLPRGYGSDLTREVLDRHYPIALAILLNLMHATNHKILRYRSALSPTAGCLLGYPGWNRCQRRDRADAKAKALKAASRFSPPPAARGSEAGERHRNVTPSQPKYSTHRRRHLILSWNSGVFRYIEGGHHELGHGPVEQLWEKGSLRPIA